MIGNNTEYTEERKSQFNSNQIKKYLHIIIIIITGTITKATKLSLLLSVVVIVVAIKNQIVRFRQRKNEND